MEAARLEGRQKEGWLDPWRGGEETCSSHHGVGGAATMEWGERVATIAVEKKRCAVEELAAAMRNEERCRSILFVGKLRTSAGGRPS